MWYPWIGWLRITQSSYYTVAGRYSVDVYSEVKLKMEGEKFCFTLFYTVLRSIFTVVLTW